MRGAPRAQQGHEGGSDTVGSVSAGGEERRLVATAAAAAVALLGRPPHLEVEGDKVPLGGLVGAGGGLAELEHGEADGALGVVGGLAEVLFFFFFWFCLFLVEVEV